MSSSSSTTKIKPKMLSSSSSLAKIKPKTLCIKDIPKDKLEDCIWVCTYDLIFLFIKDGDFNGRESITKSSYEVFTKIVEEIEFKRDISYETHIENIYDGTETQQRAVCKSFIRHISRLPVNILSDALLKSLKYPIERELSKLIGTIKHVNK